MNVQIDLDKLAGVLEKCNGNGRCQAVCPTLKITGDEAVQSPKGRIGELRIYLKTGQPSADFDKSLDTCLSCRACETACPDHLPLGWAFDTGKLIRHDYVPLSATEKTLQKHLVSKLGQVKDLHAMHAQLKLYKGMFLQGFVRSALGQAFMPRDLARMERMMPPIDPEPSRRRLPAVTPAVGGDPVMKVALFLGCVGDIAYGSIHDATVKVLAASGCEVHVVTEQVCCGAVHSHVGKADQTRTQLANNASAFGFSADEDGPYDVIVANAAGCGAMLKEAEHYAPEPAILRMAHRVRDVHELLYDLWFNGKGRKPALRPIDGLDKITMQDACHLRHGQQIARQPRWLLGQIPGLTLVEMPGHDDCCGGAGVYSLVQPAMSDAIGDTKMANLQKTGCTTCAAGNLVCIGQMALTAKRHGQTVNMVHPVELLAAALA